LYTLTFRMAYLRPQYLAYLQSKRQPQEDDDDEPVISKGKRKVGANAPGPASKRVKSSGVSLEFYRYFFPMCSFIQVVILTSSFAPGVQFSVNVPQDFIQFTTVTCKVDTETGAASLEQSCLVKTGKIETAELAGISAANLGKSKDVFKVSLPFFCQSTT
jgi:hypothetical protein